MNETTLQTVSESTPSRGSGVEEGGSKDLTARRIGSVKSIRSHPDPLVAQTVAQMVFAGMTQDTIAKVLKVGLDTLHTHYKHELDTGQASMVNDIAQSLAQRAKAGSDTAAIFLLKTRGGGKFTERNAVELTGKDGGAIQIEHRAEILQNVSGILRQGLTIDGEAEPLD